MSTRVLVTGAGQLAQELVHTLPDDVELQVAGIEALDITCAQDCMDHIAHFRPTWVFNAAAYTAVDRAESDVEAAYAVNQQGVINLAQACLAEGVRLVHVSTDFVFDGHASHPYAPDTPASPSSVYGASKLAGEQSLRALMPEAIIVRTSWLYAAQGQNFVHTMLRLMAEKTELAVVADQVGTPTWARGLALLLWQARAQGLAGGLYHWSDAGVASWYDFAVAIQDLAMELGLLERAIPVRAIPTSAYPTPAQRPAYSVLDKQATLDALGITAHHWRHQLRRMLQELSV